MLFNSLHFLIFFPIVVLIYFSIPHKYRWILLLVSSYYFYMSWKAEYIILIIISTLIDYIVAIEIYKSKNQRKRKFFLSLSILVNIGLLFAFKYFNFFNDQMRLLFNHFSLAYNIPAFKVLLPVGISFYTFQTLCYSIDVYRNKIKPLKHLGKFAVYVSFFPQLVAGPIERASHLIPQFFEKHNFDYRRVVQGLKITLWGFFLKIVVADRLAIIVDTVFNNIYDYKGFSLIFGTYFFGFQIYCDFAGYSFIAIGTAKILGFSLINNFRRPFLAKNIAEFWRRWHISLSTWFRDYAFTPFYLKLKKNRIISKFSQKMQHNISFILSTLVTLTLLGLWHGANWTFLAFGFYHSLMISLYYLTKKYWDRMNKYIQILLTFHITAFGWILFRANSISESFYAITHLFTGLNQIKDYILNTNLSKGIASNFLGLGSPDKILIAVLLIGFVEGAHILQEHISIEKYLRTRPFIRWSCYLLLLFGILLFGVFNKTPFIYFQF